MSNKWHLIAEIFGNLCDQIQTVDDDDGNDNDDDDDDGQREGERVGNWPIIRFIYYIMVSSRQLHTHTYTRKEKVASFF